MRGPYWHRLGLRRLLERCLDELGDGSVAEEVRAGLGSIDHFHQLPALADRPRLVFASMPGALGTFTHFRFRRPVIAVSDERPHPSPGFAAVHEAGHYLDLVVLSPYVVAASTRATRGKGPLADWWAAVDTSDAVAELRAKHADPGASIRLLGPDYSEADHLAYLLGPAELFARSYSQWISAAAPAPSTLPQELANARAKDYSGLWKDHDFAPVGQALTDCLQTLRWI